MFTQDEALRRIIVRGPDGEIDVIDVPGVICNVITIGGVILDPNNLSFNPATIGGLKFEDTNVSGPTLSFDISSGVIDFGGATLANVGGISSDPNDFKTIFPLASVPSNTTTTMGTISLPTGNLVANVTITAVIMANGGLTMTYSSGFKLSRYLGVYTIVANAPISITADDPIMNDVTVNLLPGGVVTVNNPTPLGISVRVTAEVLLLAL